MQTSKALLFDALSFDCIYPVLESAPSGGLLCNLLLLRSSGPFSDKIETRPLPKNTRRPIFILSCPQSPLLVASLHVLARPSSKASS